MTDPESRWGEWQSAGELLVLEDGRIVDVRPGDEVLLAFEDGQVLVTDHRPVTRH